MITTSGPLIRRLLEPLASAWHEQGATRFAFLSNGTEVTSWGWGETRLPPLSATVKSGRRHIGELHIEGVSQESFSARITSDAALVGAILDTESQLQEMTVELADCQDQLVAVFDLARASQGHINIDDVLSTLVAEASELTQACCAFVYFDDGVTARLKSFPTNDFEDQGPLKYMLNDLRGHQRTRHFDARELRTAGLSSLGAATNLIAVPVRIDGAIQAVLGVARDRNRAFSAGARALLEAIASQAGSLIASAMALQSALVRERIQRDMELAAAVQRTLIVRRLPEVGGLSLAGRYQPAAEIGGDLYDLFSRKDGKLVVTVADVTGKGIPAALVMGMMRTALHGAATGNIDPSSALNSINQELYNDLSDLNKFVTAFMGFYDPIEHVVEVANCGHSPVVYCPANGAARLLEADGPPLGVMDGDISTSRMECLGPGDVLAIGTDGISEAENPDGEMFGYDRLLELVEAHRRKDATELADSILLSVQRFSQGVAQSDDQALVVLKGAA